MCFTLPSEGPKKGSPPPKKKRSLKSKDLAGCSQLSRFVGQVFKTEKTKQMPGREQGHLRELKVVHCGEGEEFYRFTDRKQLGPTFGQEIEA